ncbi:MAG: hypothetical protein CML13_17915 [Puniceicoccaceae bacterium]|nr:hypothetical protein [Puniceicoccaceae bacterium]
MLEIFGLLLVLGLIATLILPWVNLGRISRTRSELERLKRELGELQDRKDAALIREDDRASLMKTVEAKPTESTASPSCEAGTRPVKKAESAMGANAEIRDPENATLRSCSAPESVESAEPQDWFGKVAVWVGGIALLMAGFYMIKYSIESGWLTPLVRLWLTVVFGGLLCGAGFVIGVKSSMAANQRIGQALAGAGIACLYFAAYAAVHMHGYVSLGLGFVAMVLVTVLAVLLSLKNGAPIAMMGLVGGFLTPWLMSTGPNDTVMLFGYLFLLFCGAQFLCVCRGWWALLLGSLAGVYLWSAAVIVGNVCGHLDQLAGVLIFVVGVCGVNAVWVLLAKKDTVLDASALPWLTVIRWLTWGGGLVQGLVLVLIGGFAAVDMALFSVLSVGALLLAVLREDDFIWAAWLALGAVAAGTLASIDSAMLSCLIAPLGLLSLFFVLGHWRGLVSGRVLTWRALSVTAALSAVPLLYANQEWVVGGVAVFHRSAWLWLAAVVAGLLALAGEHILRRESDAEVAGEYSAFAVFLFGFGLWTYLPTDYLEQAAAILVIGTAVYWKLRAFGRSALVASVLGLAWAACMFDHAADAVGYFFREQVGAGAAQDGMAALAWVLGFVGVVTVWGCFRTVWDTAVSKVVTRILGGVSLLGFVAIYQWLDASCMPSEWSSATVEGGLTALLAVAAVGFVYLARVWMSCHQGSMIVAGLVALRVAWLHLADAGAAGERFFFNALLLQFGLPFAASCALAWQSGAGGNERMRRVYQVAAMLLGFVWATFLVQDYYGGSYLCGDGTSTAEIYTYSLVWLLLAVTYQAIGLWRQQSVIHVGSLVLLLITIGKVFLVDAAELEGLLRVLSFLGLGLALIGIGFFYNKVVFAPQLERRAD